jgi:hypothetical protein
MKVNNEEMDKDQPNTNNQYKMVSNSFVPPNELKYVNSHPSKFIIGNPVERTKTLILPSSLLVIPLNELRLEYLLETLMSIVHLFRI